MSGATDLRRKAGMYKRMAAVRTSGGHEADRQLLTLADKLDHEAARLEGQTEPPRGANGDPAPHIAGHGRASALRRQPAARCSRCAAYLAEFERSIDGDDLFRTSYCVNCTSAAVCVIVAVDPCHIKYSCSSLLA
jgi:hypothetical protein